MKLIETPANQSQPREVLAIACRTCDRPKHMQPFAAPLLPPRHGTRAISARRRHNPRKAARSAAFTLVLPQNRPTSPVRSHTTYQILAKAAARTARSSTSFKLGRGGCVQAHCVPTPVELFHGQAADHQSLEKVRCVQPGRIFSAAPTSTLTDQNGSDPLRLVIGHFRIFPGSWAAVGHSSLTKFSWSQTLCRTP